MAFGGERYDKRENVALASGTPATLRVWSVVS
jgi:hypothetical protein